MHGLLATISRKNSHTVTVVCCAFIIIEEFHLLDYRNILRVAADPHKSMHTMESEQRRPHHTIRKVLDAAQRVVIG